MSAMLEVSGIHTFYGNIEALRGVDINVRQGEVVSLIGANGAGKTTLLMSICGNPRAARGQVVFEGQNITRHQTYDIVRLGIAQAPEGRRIFPRMTVMENLQMGATTSEPGFFDEDVQLLLLDEPSLGLAPMIVKQIFGVIRDINRSGVTVLLVEQNAFHALRLAHRGYVMANGRIVLHGTGAELLANEEVRKAYLEGG
jgi:branched-chain amino acid transport system ATP-binding protein